LLGDFIYIQIEEKAMNPRIVIIDSGMENLRMQKGFEKRKSGFDFADIAKCDGD
jgi:hypothetical protein